MTILEGQTKAAVVVEYLNPNHWAVAYKQWVGLLGSKPWTNIVSMLLEYNYICTIFTSQLTNLCQQLLALTWLTTTVIAHFAIHFTCYLDSLILLFDDIKPTPAVLKLKLQPFLDHWWSIWIKVKTLISFNIILFNFLTLFPNFILSQFFVSFTTLTLFCH